MINRMDATSIAEQNQQKRYRLQRTLRAKQTNTKNNSWKSEIKSMPMVEIQNITPKENKAKTF